VISTLDKVVGAVNGIHKPKSAMAPWGQTLTIAAPKLLRRSAILFSDNAIGGKDRLHPGQQLLVEQLIDRRHVVIDPFLKHLERLVGLLTGVVTAGNYQLVQGS
jgi:hypothetical protein